MLGRRGVFSVGGSKEEEEEGEGGSEGWHAGRKPGSRGKSATVV